MLIPRFTIRWLLVLMTVSGFFFLLVGFGVRGHSWALAISLAIFSVVFAFACYFVFFLGAFFFASLFGIVQRPKSAESPFATERPPPQLVPPAEPE